MCIRTVQDLGGVAEKGVDASGSTCNELAVILNDVEHSEDDHTPKSCDTSAARERVGSVSGILKTVSQFDTPSSAHAARRHVQFASKPDYKEPEQRTPKQGGCGLCPECTLESCQIESTHNGTLRLSFAERSVFSSECP